MSDISEPKIQSRPYRDTRDLVRIRHLLVEGQAANNTASYLHPGYLDWDTHCPPDERENKRNLHLWERWGEGAPVLVAWAMFGKHEGTFDLFVSPALYGTSRHEAVMEEYVAWAEIRARDAGKKNISPFWLLDGDTIMVRLMKVHGFVEFPTDLPPPLFERSLGKLPEISLPEGFTVREVSSVDEGRLRAWVTHSAFRSEKNWESYAADYAKFISSAVYDGERDLLVRSPDGQGASACTLWFDHVNAVGLFEPVATHPDFQGKGLGKAVMAEGLRRMKSAGMRRAIVGFDPGNVAARALYTSLGFRASRHFLSYRKEL